MIHDDLAQTAENLRQLGVDAVHEILYGPQGGIEGLSVGEARRHLVEVDPQARVALTTFGEATRLSDLAKVASKAAH